MKLQNDIRQPDIRHLTCDNLALNWWLDTICIIYGFNITPCLSSRFSLVLGLGVDNVWWWTYGQWWWIMLDLDRLLTIILVHKLPPASVQQVPWGALDRMDKLICIAHHIGHFSRTFAVKTELKPLISIYNVNHQQTNYCVNNAGLDGHMRSPPEKLHLAW